MQFLFQTVSTRSAGSCKHVLAVLDVCWDNIRASLGMIANHNLVAPLCASSIAVTGSIPKSTDHHHD